MDHKPYIRQIPGSRCAVLMVHGIAGSPAQFRDLMPVIPEDWSVYNILLDGHGGTVQEFSRSDLDYWRLQVDIRIHELLANYEKILIVAHSMGTLFAIQSAIRAPGRISALFLLQVPLTPHITAACCVGSLQVAFGRVKPGTKAEDIKNATAIELTPRLWQYVGWLPRFAELFREISRTKKLLPQLRVPTYVFQSARDELVSSRGNKILQQHPAMHYHLLPCSGHFAYVPRDAIFLRKKLRAVIKSMQ